MSKENIQGLNEARIRLIGERTYMALRLCNPNFKSKDIAPVLVELQAAIFAIESAIAYEESTEPSVYETRGLREI